MMNKLWILSISLSCQRLYCRERSLKRGGGYIIHNKKTGIHSADKYTPPRIRGLGNWHRLYNPRTSTFCFSGTFLYSVVVSSQAVHERSTDWEFQVSCLHTEYFKFQISCLRTGCFHCRVADHDSFTARCACNRRDNLWRASVFRDTIK